MTAGIPLIPLIPLIPPITSGDYIHSMRALYASGHYELAVCLIRRRHTIGFEAFVRGKYNNSEELAIHRDRMTVEERRLIETCTWDELYTQVMAEKDLRYMQRERRRAKTLYEEIDVPAFIRSAVTEYDEPSWEFPKGRRFAHERDQDCALREFEEETNIPIKDVLIVPADPDQYLREEFCGTNQKMYRNKYYVGLVHPDTEGPFLDTTNSSQTSEVGAVRWFSFEEAMQVLRPFFHEKKRVLQESYDQIVTMLTSNDLVCGRSGLLEQNPDCCSCSNNANSNDSPTSNSRQRSRSTSRKRKEPGGTAECLFIDSDSSSSGGDSGGDDDVEETTE